MLQRRHGEASEVRRKIAREDRRKMVQLLLLGKRHFPFIIAQVLKAKRLF